MKSRFCLPKLLLTIFLCSFFYFPRNAWTALPGTPSEQTNGTQSPESAAVSSPEEVTIPGPLRSFLRMAAISQKVSPEEVLPLLSRNVVVNGFQGGGGKPTEFLILLNWYMDQARELLTFAGPEGVIHVSNCAEAKPLLSIPSPPLACLCCSPETIGWPQRRTATMQKKRSWILSCAIPAWRVSTGPCLVWMWKRGMRCGDLRD